MPRNLIHADAIVDFRGVIASPGAILVDDNHIVASGSPQEIGSSEHATLTQINGVVTPSFVNIHTHLDLSGAGPVPARESLTSWIEEVVFLIRRDTSSIRDAVLKGIELVHAGGTTILGDISGTVEAAEIVHASFLEATPFVELIGTGGRQDGAIERLSTLPQAFGVEPHAPYSCGLEVFRQAFESGRPVATHVAETKAELEFAMNRTGTIAEFVKRIGAWDEKDVPWQRNPIDVILELAGEAPFIGVHLNYTEEHQVQRLADSNITVAYCPRASEYFGHTEHRWKEMIEAGVNVAIGTDSLLCLDTPGRISVIDELRFLFQQDQSNPLQLLAMGTVNGAIGLGHNPDLVTLNSGKTAGLLVFESLSDNPIDDILCSTKMPTWLN